MRPRAYMAALRAAGIERGLPVQELDQRAAALLKIDERTARRYRRDETPIPGPVEVALAALAKLRRLES